MKDILEFIGWLSIVITGIVLTAFFMIFFVSMPNHRNSLDMQAQWHMCQSQNLSVEACDKMYSWNVFVGQKQ